jgi:predicted nucleotidyltransferase
MDAAVRREVDAMMAAYCKFVHDAPGGTVVGVYLVGSYALNDLCPGSDVDFVTVLTRPLLGSETRRVLDGHRAVKERFRRGFEGLYVLADELHSPPEQATQVLRCHGRGLQPGQANPVDWELLRRHGVTVCGQARRDLEVCDAGADLRLYSRRNLSAYWTPWLKRFPRLPAFGPLRAPIAYLLAWGVLGVPRLHAAIATGEILSKSAAAEYARQVFDERWHPVIEASCAYRWRNDRESIRALVSLRPKALAFIRTAIEQASELPIKQRPGISDG